ncbi:MAG TPA: hypothetical protein VGW38_07935, partial [Chloroflexota bacterium]|nr:hypothetical protein [Chloroflexota bacterium]
LAAWALLLLSQRLKPAPGAITRVGAADTFPLTPNTYDVALVYNPIGSLVSSEVWLQAVRAEQYVSV